MIEKLLVAAGACLLLSVCAHALPASGIVPDDVWAYLDTQAPGPRSAVAYSLGGKPVRSEVSAALDQQFRDWEKNGVPSAEAYENALLSVIKLQEDPTNDLLSRMYQQDFFDGSDLDGISGALLAYSASGIEIPQTQPNTPNSLIDRVIASQQRSGGFAERPGGEPSVTVTARALTALFPYQNGSNVRSTVNRALDWLDSQQNGDGTFSVKGLPSGGATAETLVAVSLYRPDEAMFLKGGGLLKALDQFKSADGGYSEVLGGGSSVETTELAVIARCTAAAGNFPYYAPEHYPGYVEPKPVEKQENPWVVYGKFFVGFALIFGLIYLLLMLTVRIGKFAEKRKLPGSLAAQAEKEQKQNPDIQLHIPMQADIPDFDKISEQESEIGHSGDDSPKP